MIVPQTALIAPLWVNRFPNTLTPNLLNNMPRNRQFRQYLLPISWIL